MLRISLDRRRFYLTRVACAVAMTVLLVGCEGKRVTIADTFPKSAYASPWRLQGDVWSGSLEEATLGLGDEAQHWAVFEPERVWLAIYRSAVSQ